MMRGNRRLEAMRQGRNPSIRADRRNNGQVRSEAPDPAATSRFTNLPGRRQDQQDNGLQMGESTQSLLERVDMMRQQRPAQSSAIGTRPARGPQPAQQLAPGTSSPMGDFGQTNSRLERLLAIQRARLGQASGYANYPNYRGRPRLGRGGGYANYGG